MDEHPEDVAPQQYPDGSRVLFADGQMLGEVVATYRQYLIVERGYLFPTNFYVPYAAIAEAGGGDIVLALTGQDALSQGWSTPPADPVVPEAKVPRSATAPAPPSSAPERLALEPPPAPAPAADVPAVPQDTVEAVITAAPEPEVEATTSVAPTPRVQAEPDSAPPEPAAQTDPPAASVASTTPPPIDETVALEEAVEVQSFQPDASVPPPAEPEEAGTVSLPPSFVGIPGRRLTDAELWSLLEPKNAPGAAEGVSEADSAPTGTPDKPGGS